MIVPFGKIELSDSCAIDLLSESPLNTKPLSTSYSTGRATDFGNYTVSLDNLNDFLIFLKRNKEIKIESTSLEDHAMLDAYAKLINDAVSAGANAAEVTNYTRKEFVKNCKNGIEITLTAKIYKLRE